MRMALVRDGLVDNIIEATAGFDPGDGVELVPSAVAEIGWRREGGALRPPPDAGAQTPPPAPVAVGDLAFRLALNRLGLREAIETYVAAAPQDVRDWWDRATLIEADNPMVRDGLAALGRSDADLAAVFAVAASIAL